LKYYASDKFWSAYHSLSPELRALADKNYALLRKDPGHPSLRFKRVGRFWSVRIGSNHRALAVEVGEDILWFWIGPHDEYERLIR
jgi:hypothetical protein